MIAIHPTDHTRIRGTVDVVPATALVAPDQFPRQSEKESLDLFGPLMGESEVHWDGQRTVEEDGERLFISRAGNQCRESELILVPDSYDVQILDGEEIILRCPFSPLDGGRPVPPEEAIIDAIRFEKSWQLPAGGDPNNTASTLLTEEGGVASKDIGSELSFRVVERDEAGDEVALTIGAEEVEID